MLLLNVLIVLSCFASSTISQHPIKIGGIFEVLNEHYETVFKLAVNDINQQKMFYPPHKMRAQVEMVDEDDSLETGEAVCRLLKTGIYGVFGPFFHPTSLIVQSICDTMDIPHIESRWDSYQRRESCLINLHPHPSTMAKVFIDLVKEWRWNSFTILYETRDYLPYLAELLKMYDPKGFTITLKQLDFGINSGNYRPVLRQVKKSSDRNLIIDCDITILPEVLRQAQQVGLMSDEHQIIITNLDLQTIDLEPYQYSETNITGVRLIDPDSSYVKDITENWAYHEFRKGRNISEDLTAKKLRTELALTYDAVHLFAQALSGWNITEKSTKNLDCEGGGEPWGLGLSLINVMKTSTITGLSRLIKFDNEGFRSDFLLDVLELDTSGLRKIGTWNNTEGLRFTSSNKVSSFDLDKSSVLTNVTLRVMISESEPFAMFKNTSEPLYGNERYEGFGIELIEELAKELGFHYEFILQNGSDYGLMLETVRKNKADLAITDLTITAVREKIVDFTSPFMNLGIQILYKAPELEEPATLSFLGPFSNEVWVWLGVAYVGVSVLLFILGRFSPKEWQNPFPCVEEPEVLYNQFSLRNSMWFTMGALMQQGSELEPASGATRMTASIWWFFTLIMVSSYTATLAAVLTIKQPITKIESIHDLAEQTEIAYGAKENGATFEFFKGSESETFKKIYQYMKNNPQNMVKQNPLGVERVKTENYAFLMESTSIEYTIQRECSLAKVGDLLDDKGYGIAMRQNTPYRHALSSAVLRLQENGKLGTMKKKWWEEKRGGGACSGDDSGGDGSVQELSMKNVGGVFLVTVIGCVVGFVINIFEWCNSIYKRKKLLKSSFWEEMKSEVKFVIHLSADTKPVQIPPESPAPSMRSRRSSFSRNLPRRRGTVSPCSFHGSIRMKH